MSRFSVSSLNSNPQTCKPNIKAISTRRQYVSLRISELENVMNVKVSYIRKHAHSCISYNHYPLPYYSKMWQRLDVFPFEGVHCWKWISTSAIHPICHYKDSPIWWSHYIIWVMLSCYQLLGQTQNEDTSLNSSNFIQHVLSWYANQSQSSANLQSYCNMLITFLVHKTALPLLHLM
jgi:hypothetical protein